MPFQAEIITFFAAMLPFVEIKLAIPLGLKLGLSTSSTFIFAVSGNILPAAFTLWALPYIVNFSKKHSKFLRTHLDKILNKTQKEHSKNFIRFGSLFILLFVATPLPGSGSAAGSLIAYIFGVDYWKALGLIIIGVFISAILLLTGFGSIFALLNIL